MNKTGDMHKTLEDIQETFVEWNTSRMKLLHIEKQDANIAGCIDAR